MKRFLLAALGLALAGGAAAGPSSNAHSNAGRTGGYFASIRHDPVALAIFLRGMPKGGDLHNHLAGAVYAESLIAWAARDGLCVQRATLSLAPPPCDPVQARPAADAAGDPQFQHDLVDAFSMRDFVPSARVSGHDQFFATFGRFFPATLHAQSEMVAAAMNQAGLDKLDYIELMDSPGMDAARALAATTPWSENFEDLHAQFAPGVAAEVERVRRALDATDAGVRAILRCDDARTAQPGCRVTVRYLAQVIRTFPAAQVFVQSQLAYALAAADPRVVGVNLVAPEDDPTTLRDYDKQMRLLGWLGRRYPGVKLSLHAGEVALGLVPPEALRAHIHDAVTIAGARRIGHGVDVASEDHAADLLKTMAARKILVEINLTSNDVILGVRGADHPFQTYRRAGVPVALSSDDEGVSRIDLTHEFVRAVTSYGLDYAELKTLVRNSLEYAFLPGASLWSSTAPFRHRASCPSSSDTSGCRELFAHSERAAMQARLEAELALFEATLWGGYRSRAARSTGE